MTKQTDHHLTPAPENLGAFMQRGLAGKVTMLNLMRFRETADYSATANSHGDNPVSGSSAYRRYIEDTVDLIADAGGEVVLSGEGGSFLIGPLDEKWDATLAIRFPDVAAFVAFTSTQEYQSAAVHRTAALEDSRILPIQELPTAELFG